MNPLRALYDNLKQRGLTPEQQRVIEFELRLAEQNGDGLRPMPRSRRRAARASPAGTIWR